MRNRPKPPPHIQKRKDEEAKKNAQRKMRAQTKTLHHDIRNMTGNDFGNDLHTEGDSESFNTHYSNKPSLNKIKEEREEIGKINKAISS
jgi:hypothetical protein